MMRTRGGGKRHVCGTRPGGGGAWGERSGLVYAASVVRGVSGDAECEGLWLLADVLSFQQTTQLDIFMYSLPAAMHMVGRSGRYVGQIECFGVVYLLCYSAYDHFSVQNVIFRWTFMPVKPDV